MGLCRLFHRLRCFWRLTVGTVAMLCLPATAQDFQDLEQLRSQVGAFLERHYDVADVERTEIDVSHLDRRLRLAPCAESLVMQLGDEARRGGNLTIHTRCPGPTTWALYVPAQIAVYRPVVVARRSLGRGELLAGGDLTTAVHDTGQLRQGFVSQLDSVVNKELRRPLKEGEPVRMGILVEPTVVKRGDQVRIEAQAGTISVNTTGTAMSSGRVGDQVRVRNDRSERVIRGRVTGPGTIEVIL